MSMTNKGRALALSAAMIALLGAFAPTARAETRSYAVAYFGLASNAVEGGSDCAGGINPQDMSIQFRKDLAQLGKTPKEIDELFKDGLSESAVVLPDVLTNRGRVDGKPVNAYSNPQTVADPKLNTIDPKYKYAYGFNLDGKGTSSPNSFEDPVTHEKGVNNQVWRALGCLPTLRAVQPERPSQWTWVWNTLRESMPAWIISVSADDLSKDGPVTITVDRALEHVMLDVKGETRADATFRIDPSPQSHNVFKGKIEKGAFEVTEQADLHLLGDPFLFTELGLKKAKLRLTPKPDGSMNGIVAGYQELKRLYFIFAAGSHSEELNLAYDVPGVYHALRKNADADPDPKTGLNQSISASYEIDVVPAFIAPAGPTREKTASVK